MDKWALCALKASAPSIGRDAQALAQTGCGKFLRVRLQQCQGSVQGDTHSVDLKGSSGRRPRRWRTASPGPLRTHTDNARNPFFSGVGIGRGQGRGEGTDVPAKSARTVSTFLELSQRGMLANL